MPASLRQELAIEIDPEAFDGLFGSVLSSGSRVKSIDLRIGQHWLSQTANGTTQRPSQRCSASRAKLLA
jgi:hypothetical protein